MFKVYWTDKDGKSQGMSFQQGHVADEFSKMLRETGNTFVVAVEATQK